MSLNGIGTPVVAESEDKEPKAKTEYQWPEPIGSIWKAFKADPRGEEFRKLVTDQFSSAENPYESAILLTERSPDYCRCSTLSLAILELFSSWIGEEKREEKFANLLTLDIQKRAFSMATAEYTKLLKTAVVIFHLLDVSEKFVDVVKKELVDKKRFREAAECAIALRIQQHFDLNKIIIPCILQGENNYVEPYLADHTNLQQKLVKVLDELFGPSFKTDHFLSRHHIQGIQKDKLCLKDLQKLVGRLSKLYNIPDECSPNLVRTRRFETLIFILRQRYDKKRMHVDDFNDWVRKGIETCPALLDDLLRFLCSKKYKDFQEAAKWAGYFGVKKAKLPWALKDYIGQHPEALHPVKKIKREDTSQMSVVNGEFLQLPIEPGAIILVNDEELLEQALTQIEKAELVGLDMEREPHFAPKSVALLQVATSTNVFLLDIQTMKTNVREEILKNAMHRLFCQDTPRKLGFGIDDDMKQILLTLPSCREDFENLSNTVCMKELIKLLRKNSNFVPDLRLQKTNGSDGGGDKVEAASAKVNFNLAGSCYYILGKPLDKSEQCSNWSLRPLRWEQVRYAALDAFCLIVLFEKLRLRADELKIDFELAVSRSLVKGTKATKTGPEKILRATKMLGKAERLAERLDLIKKLNISMEKQTSFRQAADVRVVVDDMLQGLGKHLQQCGIDCRLHKKSESREALITVANEEKRIFLTSGNAVLMAAARLPFELICHVPSTINAKEQLAWFLEMMKIRVTEDCNCQNILLIPSRLLRIVYDSVVAPSLLNMVPFNREIAFEVIRDHLKAVQSSNVPEEVALPIITETSEPSFTIDDEKWVVELGDGKLDLLTGSIMSMNSEDKVVRLQIESIQESAFNELSLPPFRLCCDCGKIWDSSQKKDLYVNNV